MKALVFAAFSAATFLAANPAAAQFAPVQDPAPGYSALMSADYASAEREIRGAPVSKYDPARSINLGIALAKTGQADRAARQFQHVLMEQDVELVLANGETVMSHDVARRALASLQNGALSR